MPGNDEFFRAVLGNSEGYLGLSFTKEGVWKNKYFDYPSQVSEAVETVTRLDSKGWDCYFIPSVLRHKHRRKASFKESNVVWIDYDRDTPTEFTPEPNIIVTTSPNHYHAYWQLTEPATALVVETTNQSLIALNDADPSGKDCTQLLRVPNTLSKKRDYPVEITYMGGTAYPATFFPPTWLLRQTQL